MARPELPSDATFSATIAATFRAAAGDDLAHEALLRALEHPPGDRNANLGPWMQRIFRNLRVDAWRAEARARTLASDVPLPPPPPGADDAALARERRREIRRAVLALPRAQRRALILRFQAGWPFDRIADRLGVEEPTARTRVHRALAALRGRLATLKAMVMPGTLALQPALAVVIVLAAEPVGMLRPERVSPAAPPVVASAVPHHATRSVRLADAAPAAPTPAASRKTAAPKTDSSRSTARSDAPPPPQRFDFEGDPVTGEFDHPWLDPVIGDTRATHQSLIEIRRDLIPEMVKALENI